MNQAFLILKDQFGDDRRINIAHISHYSQVGTFTYIFLTNSNGEQIAVQNSIEEIEQSLSELYCTIKKVPLNNE